jgi:hypothetical protein
MQIGLGIGLPFKVNLITELLSLTNGVKRLFSNGEKGVWFDPSDLTQDKLTFRKNSLLYSEQFDNGNWSKVLGATVTPNTGVAPDGTTSVDTINFNSTSGNRLEQFRSANAVLNEANTFSLWMAGTGTININCSDAASVGTEVTITLTGTLTRYSVTCPFATAPSGAVRGMIIWRAGNTATTVQVWGAQLEVGSTATSYQKITDYYTEFAAAFPMTALYQDSAGTTPVTAMEQPVGLMLDKSQGLVLGSELVTTPNITAVNIGGPAFTNYTTGASVVAGKQYKISFTVSGYAGSGNVGFAGSVLTGTTAPTGNGVYTNIISAPGSGTADLFSRSTNTCQFSAITIRELPGNHATQPTAINRPVISARYNQLSYSERFDDAVWGATGAFSIDYTNIVSPDGNKTGNKITSVTGSSATSRVVTATATAYKFSIYAKAGTLANNLTSFLIRNNTTATSLINIELNASNNSTIYGSAITTSLSNGWIKVDIIATSGISIGDAIGVYFGATSSITPGLYWYVWGADLRPTIGVPLTLPAYQRVNTSTDYDTIGFNPYLSFNGTNQWMVTPSIDFSVTDKMTVWAGAAAASTGYQIIAETSVNSDGNAGSLRLDHDDSAGRFSMQFIGGTSTRKLWRTPATFAAPTLIVLSSQANLAANTMDLRAQGGVITITKTVDDVLAGNMGNYPLYLGARAGSSLFFNGRLYELITRGAQSTTQQITDGESLVRLKTGAY